MIAMTKHFCYPTSIEFTILRSAIIQIEASYLDVFSIKLKETNKLRKEQENYIKFIMDTWEKFKNNKISMNDYLQAIRPRKKRLGRNRVTHFLSNRGIISRVKKRKIAQSCCTEFYHGTSVDRHKSPYH
ncbi:hypothetical protein QTP88_015031 [Uroleucon formosanum]